VTCAQLAFLPTLESSLDRAIYDGRIAENQGSLRPLDEEAALILVIDRLRRCIDLQQLRSALGGRGLQGVDDEAWPLRSGEVRDRARSGALPARTLLVFCREMFEERRDELLRTRAVAPSQLAPPSVPRKPTPTLADVLASELAEQAARPGGIDTGVYEDGLLRAAHLCAPPGASLHASKVRDISLEVQRGSGRIGVSVCNAENMRSLAARFDHLLQASHSGRFERLVMVRDARLPISPTARVTNARLAELQAGGCAVVRPPAEAYQALAAIRKLLADAAAGDLTLDGRTVEVAELKDWLAHNLPTPVRDLVDQVLGSGGEEQSPLLATLQALLQEEGMLALEVAAGRAGVALDAAREAVVLQPQIVGLLTGPPEVVYLHPDGMRRG
jgi:hypothetical protein